MTLRICLLTDETIDTFNPSIYMKDYEWDMVTLQPPVAEFMNRFFTREQYDVYFNLFEGFEDDDSSGYNLVTALEALNLPFTGGHKEFYAATREQMQTAAETHGIRFARGFHATQESDLEQASLLNFPLIVKHPNSFASAGLTRDSRVDALDQLHTQFERMHALFGAARVEEFIEGDEVSCLVVDNPEELVAPFAYLPAQVSFPPDETFLHEEAKWFNWDVYVVPLKRPELAPGIQEISKRMYIAINGSGYARVDLRVRPNGELVIIEINPNCGILYGPDDRSHADLPISWDADGHKGFLDRIFRSAIARQKIRTFKQKQNIP
jgi:D-alanine-D-alanine ligase-like ATP-grasp enzyme